MNNGYTFYNSKSLPSDFQSNKPISGKRFKIPE